MTTTIHAEGILTELVEEAEAHALHVETLRHEDGSVTVVGYDEFYGELDPREHYDHVGRLVSDTSGWVELDEADRDIEQMREAAEVLGRGAGTTVWNHPTNDWELNIHEHPEYGQEVHLILMEKRSYGGGTNHYRVWLDLNDPHEAWAALGYFEGWSAEETVRKYIEAERPDIAHYDHDWTVLGSSPSEWRDGWGYMLVSDFIEGADRRLLPHEQAAAKKLYEAEFAEYRAWFGGEVYSATHIFPVGPDYRIEDQGGYYTGETLAATDTVHGFIGYEAREDIALNFTDSPVLEV